MKKQKFTFIDLFAGIGGFHLAMHRLGGECVFASEIDESARKTYETNFEQITPLLFKKGLFNSDIRSIAPFELPDFDLLCAGFPCQPFSQAGQKRGFEDNHNSERGNLFFNIVDIIQAKRPKAFFLENVRGLVNHDNGNTLKVIRNILENELGYSFYIKIVNASDYGLPQLRPRAFMIGFRDEHVMRSFEFPTPKKLKFTMSDVWGGVCSRDIGFTLRVGGRGSNINDRRNWDSYLVDGEVRRLSPKEGKKMQGFPDDFILPTNTVQAMKQLGNSVAVDAIEAVGASLVAHMFRLDKNKINMTEKKNKGEWSELYVFIQLLLQQRLYLANDDLTAKSGFFNVNNVTTLNLDKWYVIEDEKTINITDKESGKLVESVDISNIVTKETMDLLRDAIKSGSGAFSLNEFSVIQDSLGLSIIKGGSSLQKSDIVVDIENMGFRKKDEGFGIKSYLGMNPTLFNASGTTNFIFKVCGVDSSVIDEINSIDSKQKIKDRITSIIDLGGQFEYVGPENSTLDFNLKLVDGDMSNIIGRMLMSFYRDRISSIKKIALLMSATQDEQIILEVKIKKLLVDILLGFFPGKRWNGTYSANGMIVVRQDGGSVAFHIIELEDMKEYLFNTIKFDTPSSTRHRFGKLYLEKDGNIYFKLNMQLRF